jgi:hypothetical protein
MSDTSATVDRSAGRRRLDETRRRLDSHVREGATLIAPSRLLSAGVDAIRVGAGAQVDRVAAMAANPQRRPPLLTALGAAFSLVLGLLARRRERLHGPLQTGRTNTVVRTGSPWLGLALTIATAYLGRSTHPAR